MPAAAAAQDQWEDVTPGLAPPKSAASAPKAVAKADDGWEDVNPPPAAPTAPTPAPPTPLERFAEITTGSRHPFRDTAVALGQWRDKPVESLENLGKNTAMALPKMASDILTRPVQTVKSVTGGEQFAEDVANRRYGAAAADLGAGIVNSAAILGGPEGMEASADAAARGISAIQDVTEKPIQSVKDSIGRAARTEPTVDTVGPKGNLDAPKRFSTLKPGVKAAASVARIVGGPEVVNAIIPEHPVKIGPYSRLSNRIPVPEPELPGVAPTEPSAGEFYENRAVDLINRQKAQDALDRQAARESARAEKSRISIVSEGSGVTGPRPTGSEGRPATWTNERVQELAKQGNRDAIAQLTRRGLPLPENARYIMGDQDFPRSNLNPREVTKFTPEGTAIRDVANPLKENPSSRARIQIVGESPEGSSTPPTPQTPLRFDVLPGAGRTIPQIEQPIAAVGLGPERPVMAQTPQTSRATPTSTLLEPQDVGRVMPAHKAELEAQAGRPLSDEEAAALDRANLERGMVTAKPGNTLEVREAKRAELEQPGRPVETVSEPAETEAVDLGSATEGPKKPRAPRERAPREQLQNFDAETLEEAKMQIAAASDMWGQFEKPGRYFSQPDATTGSDLDTLSEITHGVKSARPSLESQFPWLKKLPQMTAGKLKAAVESGKGVEYTRLLNEAGKHIQEVHASNAPVIEEFRGELENTAQQIQDVEPELAQTLRDILAGKYSSYSDLSDFVKGKLNDAESAKAFSQAVTDLSAEERSENVQDLGPQGPEVRQGNLKATELGPPRKPQTPNQSEK